jgi:hypothetical protein
MAQQDTSEQQKLIIKLEENAMDSLVRGIEYKLYGRRNLTGNILFYMFSTPLNFS